MKEKDGTLGCKHGSGCNAAKDILAFLQQNHVNKHISSHRYVAKCPKQTRQASSEANLNVYHILPGCNNRFNGALWEVRDGEKLAIYVTFKESFPKQND